MKSQNAGQFSDFDLDTPPRRSAGMHIYIALIVLLFIALSATVYSVGLTITVRNDAHSAQARLPEVEARAQSLAEENVALQAGFDESTAQLETIQAERDGLQSTADEQEERLRSLRVTLRGAEADVLRMQAEGDVKPISRYALPIATENEVLSRYEVFSLQTTVDETLDRYGVSEALIHSQIVLAMKEASFQIRENAGPVLSVEISVDRNSINGIQLRAVAKIWDKMVLPDLQQTWFVVVHEVALTRDIDLDPKAPLETRSLLVRSILLRLTEQLVEEVSADLITARVESQPAPSE